MNELKALVITLHEWQVEAIEKTAGLREPAAYQRVIDECKRLIKEAEND